MDSFDITKYLDMAFRRKYWIIIPFLLVILAGMAHILQSPRIYQAKTLILVHQQKVPQDFVRAIISSGIEDRLRTITQQVTSRTNLEKTIREYGLYGNPPDNKMILEDKVKLLRAKIKVDVVRGGRGGNSFSISFQGKDPKKVMQVTNALASNFISENLKIRESQALGTSQFMADELDSITKRLVEKEERLKEYRLRFMGALPDQLQTNLNILGRLQMQLEQLNSSLSSAESRKLIIQQHIADSERLGKKLSEEEAARLLRESVPSPTAEVETSEEAISLKRELDALESKYTPNHPDVIRLKKMIAKLETRENKPKVKAEEAVVQLDAMPPEEGSEQPRVDNALNTQLQQINIEIEDIKDEIKKVQSRMEIYQRRVEETPKREQELISLNRDYDNLRGLYNSMLGRKLEAEIAVSMEKKQKGEQFRVIDPAKIPARPIKPDVKKLMIMILAFGLGLGCGLAYLVEFMDTSYRTPEEVEKELQLPVLVSMPFRYTEKELKRLKRRKVIAAVSVAIGFIISFIGVFIASKGVDMTLTFIKGIIDNL